jgi:hypothetical protein
MIDYNLWLGTMTIVRILTIPTTNQGLGMKRNSELRIISYGQLASGLTFPLML